MKKGIIQKNQILKNDNNNEQTCNCVCVFCSALLGPHTMAQSMDIACATLWNVISLVRISPSKEHCHGW